MQTFLNFMLPMKEGWFCALVIHMWFLVHHIIYFSSKILAFTPAIAQIKVLKNQTNYTIQRKKETTVETLGSL